MARNGTPIPGAPALARTCYCATSLLGDIFFIQEWRWGRGFLSSTRVRLFGLRKPLKWDPSKGHQGCTVAVPSRGRHTKEPHYSHSDAVLCSYGPTWSRRWTRQLLEANHLKGSCFATRLPFPLFLHRSLFLHFLLLPFYYSAEVIN